MENHIDVEHNISYNSHNGNQAKPLMSQVEDKNLNKSNILGEINMKKPRKYSLDEEIKLDPDKEGKLQLLKFRKAVRIISIAMLKFGLKLKERKQVLLRVFAKHHMKHVKFLDNFIKNYLDRKHQAPIDHLKRMYEKLFVRKLLEDLKALNDYIMYERHQEMQMQEVMKIKEIRERERIDTERMQRLQAEIEEQNKMMEERRTVIPKIIEYKEKLQLNDSFDSELDEGDDYEDQSQDQDRTVPETERMLDENEEAKFEISQVGENEVVDDEMFGHIKNGKNIGGGSPHKYQSMQVKLPNVIELYHDSRKSTYVFKDEDSPHKARGITQLKPNIKLTAFGKNLVPNQTIKEEATESEELSSLKFEKIASKLSSDFILSAEGNNKDYDSFDMNDEGEDDIGNRDSLQYSPDAIKQYKMDFKQ